MHKVYDENGNLIQSGHEHQHQAEHGKDEKLVLLDYMLHHNEQHAAELAQMAERLGQEGHKEEAEEIRRGVADFQKGNAHLAQALEALKNSTHKS